MEVARLVRVTGVLLCLTNDRPIQDCECLRALAVQVARMLAAGLIEDGGLPEDGAFLDDRDGTLILARGFEPRQPPRQPPCQSGGSSS
jgi:hypothetical protein